MEAKVGHLVDAGEFLGRPQRWSGSPNKAYPFLMTLKCVGVLVGYTIVVLA